MELSIKATWHLKDEKISVPLINHKHKGKLEDMDVALKDQAKVV